MGLAALYPSYEVWPTAKHGVRCGFRSTASTAHEPVPHQVHRAVDRRRGRARPRAQKLAQRLGPDDPGGGGGRRRGALLGRCARGGRLRGAGGDGGVLAGGAGRPASAEGRRGGEGWFITV